MASFLRQIPLLTWFAAKPLPLPVHASNVTFFYETGPNLIDAIYAAIVRGQHVALSGPRGCGKSYCISQAVEKAKSAGIVPDNAVIKIQGNKEIPRDYLIEDEITLAVRNIDGQSRVVPETKFAPLFRTAARDGDGKPITNADGFVQCLDTLGQSFNSGDAGKKMVLFLDEINRFFGRGFGQPVTADGGRGGRHAGADVPSADRCVHDHESSRIRCQRKNPKPAAVRPHWSAIQAVEP